MRANIWIIGFAALALSACAAPPPTQVALVDHEYAQRLNARLNGYNDAADMLDAALNQEAAPAAIQAQEASGKDAAAAEKIAQDVFHSAELRNRATLLNVFILQIPLDGDIARMQKWLGGETAQAATTREATATLVGLYRQDFQRDPSSPDAAAAYLMLVKRRGADQGASEELATIEADIQSYARDYADAAARDAHSQPAP